MALGANAVHEGILVKERRAFELICECIVRAIGWDSLTTIDYADIKELTFCLFINRINIKHTGVTLKNKLCVFLHIRNMSAVSN